MVLQTCFRDPGKNGQSSRQWNGSMAKQSGLWGSRNPLPPLSNTPSLPPPPWDPGWLSEFLFWPKRKIVKMNILLSKLDRRQIRCPGFFPSAGTLEQLLYKLGVACSCLTLYFLSCSFHFYWEREKSECFAVLKNVTFVYHRGVSLSIHSVHWHWTISQHPPCPLPICLHSNVCDFF